MASILNAPRWTKAPIFLVEKLLLLTDGFSNPRLFDIPGAEVARESRQTLNMKSNNVYDA